MACRAPQIARRLALSCSVPLLRHAPPPLRSISTTCILREQQSNPSSVPIGRVERRLQITFTCTADVESTFPAEEAESEAIAALKSDGKCGHRSTHEFSRRSYEKGIVLVECPACNNRHLIADHMQWFSQTPSPGQPKGQDFGKEKPRTIEDLMREKGEAVRWIDGGPQGATWELEG